DHPAAPAVPAAAAGAEDRPVLAGGRRGGAGAPARLHDPGARAAPGLTRAVCIRRAIVRSGTRSARAEPRALRHAKSPQRGAWGLSALMPHGRVRLTPPAPLNPRAQMM